MIPLDAYESAKIIISYAWDWRRDKARAAEQGERGRERNGENVKVYITDNR